MNATTEAKLREEATNHQNGTKPVLEPYVYKERIGYTEVQLSDYQMHMLEKARSKTYYSIYVDADEYRNRSIARDSLRLLLSRGLFKCVGKFMHKMSNSRLVNTYEITTKGRNLI